jgi:hypothetical protein
MKKIIIALALSVSALGAQNAYTTYPTGFGKKTMEIKISPDAKIYIDMTSLDDISPTVGMVIDTFQVLDLIECLKMARSKFAEWRAVAGKNGVRSLRKELECNALAPGYFQYGGEWQFDFLGQSRIYYLINHDKKKGVVSHEMVLHTGKLTSSSNEFISSDGGVIVFDTPEKIDAFIAKIQPAKIRAHMNSPRKEDLFR